MPRNSKKNSERKNNFNKKSELSNFEIIQFLQYEYDWQKQRKSDLIDKVQLFICWNAAIFAFAILFTDFDKIVTLLKRYRDCNITTLTILLICFMIISITILLISTIGFFVCLKVQKSMCFEMEHYIDEGFDINKILNDYKTIITDYDDVIKSMADKIEKNTTLMVIGISGLLVSELFLRVLVCI